VTAFAATPRPSPMTMTGIVRVDNWQRNLVVSRPDTLSGYQRHSWRIAHEHLVRAERVGWDSNTPT
jgi:hypothetical protein